MRSRTDKEVCPRGGAGIQPHCSSRCWRTWQWQVDKHVRLVVAWCGWETLCMPSEDSRDVPNGTEAVLDPWSCLQLVKAGKTLPVPVPKPEGMEMMLKQQTLFSA